VSTRRQTLARGSFLGLVWVASACQLIAGLGERTEGTAGAPGGAGTAGHGGSSTAGATNGGSSAAGRASGGKAGSGGGTTSSGGSSANGGASGSSAAAGEAGEGASGGVGGTSTGSGGTSTGSGGTTANAGQGTGAKAGSGTGGQGGSGGVAAGGTGGSAAGHGGNGGNGGTGGSSGSGGTGGGTGGSGATGGAGGGTGGSAGTAGSAGTGGAGPLLPDDIVPGLDGYLWEATPAGTLVVSGTNYPVDDAGSTCSTSSNWDTSGTIRNHVINVTGTAGTQYTIKVWVKGVVGTRCYTGGVPASTATPIATGNNDTWYVGGTQANNSWWNTFELHVETALPPGANVYYLNAFPSSNPAGWCEKESTFLIDYQHTFAVMGNSTIRLTFHDSNCQAQQNCGATDSAPACQAPRTVDLSDMSPPGTFSQPLGDVIGSSTYYPQWLYIDVVQVTSP
jgi:hypothetical protein